MPKLAIPTIGGELTLTEDWTFALYPESVNEGVWNILTGGKFNWATGWVLREIGVYEQVTLPKGTVMKVIRVYIRQDFQEFDSVTFRIWECPSNPDLIKERFWVKLEDANCLDAKWEARSVPVRVGGTQDLDGMMILPRFWGHLKNVIPADLLADMTSKNPSCSFGVKWTRKGLIVIANQGQGEVDVWKEGDEDV